MSNVPRTPGRRGRSGPNSGEMAKPKARYLYDDTSGCSVSSDVSVGDVSSLDSFAMASWYEDEKSEITDKMHNLSAVKYGRRFPKHHSAYRYYQEHQQAWQNEKRVRFLEDDATPISALTEDAVVSVPLQLNDSIRFNDAHAPIDEDFEYPTNVSHSSESRSTAESHSSFDDDDEQVKLMVRGYASRREDAADDVPEISSIGIVTREKPSLLARCVPSISTMSRWFFLLGCVLTLWIATNSLEMAREQQKQTSNQPHETRLRRLSTDGLQHTHQQQWDSDNTSWTQLPQDQQDSWGELGFTQEGWDDHDGISSDNIDWDNLTPEQEEAALALGFTKPVWNHYYNGTGDRQDVGLEAQVQREEVIPDAIEAPSASPSQAPTSDALAQVQKEDANSIETLSGQVSQAPNSELETQTQAPSSDQIVQGPQQEDASIEVPVSVSTATPTTSPSPANDPHRDNDAIMFAVGDGSIGVTKSMVLSFAAGLCFTMVGIIEWIRHDYFFQLMLAISGVWGLLSSVFIYRSPTASLAFHTLSVHCFLAAATAILWLRCRQTGLSSLSRRSSQTASRTQEEALLLADLCFAMGAAMAVVSSYLTLAHGIDKAALTVDIQRFDVFAAILWVACAVIYLCCTCKANRNV